MVSCAVDTAAPEDVAALPVLASALVVVLRAELLLAVVAAAVSVVAVADFSTTLTGVTVPPGALVSAVPGAPPPDRFAYLPFGVGPRVCIGAQFALTEATLVLATLIQTFHVERADDTPVTPRAVVTTQPDHPPPFRLQLR